MDVIPPLLSRRVQITVVAGVSFAVHLWLILAFPIVFGGDSIVRLVNKSHILLSHQLPLLQLCIYVLGRLSSDVIFIRLFISFLAVLSSIGFYLLVGNILDYRAAFLAALLFATNPFVVAVSTVPYQEILMLAGLLFAFLFFFEQRWLLASACLAVACFTRYEAWAACPVLALAFAQQRGFRAAQLAKSAILFGWAPLTWIAFRRGLAPSGSFVIDHSITLWRVQRLAYLGWITAKETAIPTLVLAVLGAVIVVRERKWRDQRFLLGGAFLLLFFVAVLFSAHGDSPDPERYVSSREAHIPITAVTLLAAFALVQHTRIHLALVGLGVALGIYGAFSFVHHETSRPEIRLGYELARYIDKNVSSQDYVMVLANPIALDSLETYFDKVRELSGEAGVREARKKLENVDTSPLDYQRLIIHTHFRKDQLTAFPRIPPKLDWIAVWSNFVPTDTRSAQWAQQAFADPVAILRCGDRSVAIYHLRDREQP